MSAIGPQPPPHLRKDNEHEEKRPRQRPDVFGPIPPRHMRTEYQKHEAEVSPADETSRQQQTDDLDEWQEEEAFMPALPPDLTNKPKHLLGPSMSAHLPSPVHDDSGLDEIGPMPAVNEEENVDSPVIEFLKREERLRKAREEPAKPQKLRREEWMLVPPTSSGLLGSLDPTKLKSRQFSRSARPSLPTEDMSLWTETPEQKQDRLKDEVTGKRRRATEIEKEDNDEGQRKRNRYEAEITAQIEDYNRRTRGDSLVGMHQSVRLKDSSKEKEVTWDHARDMAVGGRLMSQQQRSKMIKDAHGLGERFGKGKSGFL